ncbi:hypothetical protein EVAR_51980_1 [Eumeta japonica]|uniref:Secreted protein n=1 Tax=Eumeta variegata TaxID=151549 RepID=A0A4C1Y5X7_EUMVA|nr:hypothetical protein EVAR_51980_1 [Eumeta japonica]
MRREGGARDRFPFLPRMLSIIIAGSIFLPRTECCYQPCEPAAAADSVFVKNAAPALLPPRARRPLNSESRPGGGRLALGLALCSYLLNMCSQC